MGRPVKPEAILEAGLWEVLVLNSYYWFDSVIEQYTRDMKK